AELWHVDSASAQFTVRPAPVMPVIRPGVRGPVPPPPPTEHPATPRTPPALPDPSSEARWMSGSLEALRRERIINESIEEIERAIAFARWNGVSRAQIDRIVKETRLGPAGANPARYIIRDLRAAAQRLAAAQPLNRALFVRFLASMATDIPGGISNYGTTLGM